MACKRSTAPHTLNTHTIEMAQDARAARAKVATPARMAATRSPYAAGRAKAGDSAGETTPGIRKLSPTNRKVWGMTKGMRASVRRLPRSRGQMYTFVTRAKASKLIKMLSPNTASLRMDRLLACAGSRFRGATVARRSREGSPQQRSWPVRSNGWVGGVIPIGLHHASRGSRLGVAGMRRPRGRDQQPGRLFLRDRAMRNPLGSHAYFPWAKMDVAISHTDGKPPLQNKEEVIRVIMLGPDELALHFDHHEVMSVELADGSRLPVLRTSRELSREVDDIHVHYLPPVDRVPNAQRLHEAKPRSGC